jgi:hypothetical protein
MTMSATDARAPRSGSRIALSVVGAIAVLIGIVALVGGGALVGVHETQRDSDGYYASGNNDVATPTHAFVSDELDVGTDGPDLLFRDGRLGTVRVTATGTDAKPIFVGVARQADVDAYLRGVAHDDVTDFDLDPFTLDVARSAGTRTPVAPAERNFWAASASGTGEQTVAWPVQRGSWEVVVMNADGTPGVRSELGVGAKLNILLGIGVALIAIGGILAALGALLLFGRPRRVRKAPTAAPAVPAEAGGAS